MVAWSGVAAGPGMILALIRHEASWDGEWPTIGFAFGLTLQSLCGYAIWASWFGIAAGWVRSARWFWVVACLHHLAWLLLWGFGHHVSGIVVYVLIVGFVCVVAAMLPQRAQGQAPPPPVRPVAV